MHFDFYERYKEYSDAELWKITQQPDAYQPEAVGAASGILKERGAAMPAPTKEQTSGDLLDSFDLTEDVKPPMLLVFCLALVALEYLWKLYNTVNALYLKGLPDDIRIILIALVPFVYNAFVFYLLLKRKSWGWILLFISTAISVNTGIIQLGALLSYMRLEFGRGLIFMAITFLHLLLVISLWQKGILAYFNITREAKFRTLVAAVSISVAIAIFAANRLF